MTTATCVHWWKLGDPHAGTVHGRCDRCGDERTWSAFTMTDYDTSHNASARRGAAATRRLRLLSDEESDE